ncbi:uncharacterized protein JCM6883_007123 [Sporobolomyces salmoneus]|uniref:uncharacterized protein n=1 Tax=Sporobolomyces salmoneus TaxID=183962 RepID=UPI00317A1644
MASFFGNRPSYVTASWANQRIYPRTEPTFNQPESEPSLAPPRSTSSTPAITPIVQGGEGRPTQPPPLYFPGANRQRTLSQSENIPSASTHIPSINSASTRLSIIPWQSHPIPLLTKDSSLSEKIRKWLRVEEVWSCLKQEPEVLWDGWPVEFGGKPFARRRRSVDEEEAHQGESSRLSRITSRRSGSSRADSGIVLSMEGDTHRRHHVLSMEGDTHRRHHVLEPLYRKRVAELNKLISESLIVPRGWLAMTEMMWITWFVALIVALGQGGGSQTGFLKGVEIGLVCVIILSALAINGVRMRRWALAEQLRKRTRDWSPLPITSSTNTQLMRNYLDGEADPREVAQQVYKESPVLRWRLREVEGGYWLAYRPVIRCELITPATRSNPQMLIDPVEIPDTTEESVSGERQGEGVVGELPPGYEEDATQRTTSSTRSGR